MTESVAHFTGFDSGPVSRPSRTVPAYGGGQQDKHRANKAASIDGAATSGSRHSVVAGSGIVDASSSSGASPPEEEAVSHNLAKYGGAKRKSEGEGATTPSKPHVVGAVVVHLNAEKATELEARMLADAARATKDGKDQEDVFEDAYNAIAAKPQSVTPSKPPAPPAPGNVQDSDFDF